MSLSQYRDILGKPNQGLHSYRLGPFAAVDLIGTILIGGMLGYYFISRDIPGILIGFLALLILSIILHNIFTVDTALNMRLFGKYDESTQVLIN